MASGEPAEVQQLAGHIGASVQLQAIVLRELNWTLPELNVPPGLAIDLRPEFEAQAAMTPELLVYKIQTDVSAVIPDEIEIFHFTATYQVVCSYPEGTEFSRDEVEAFGSTSVMLMVFPYVRETLQNTAAKAGVPGILLQPLRLPFPATADQAATNQPVGQ
jgi:preprotein translocase subunit SecB